MKDKVAFKGRVLTWWGIRSISSLVVKLMSGNCIQVPGPPGTPSGLRPGSPLEASAQTPTSALPTRPLPASALGRRPQPCLVQGLV